MPLQRRLPKRGFTNIFRKEYVVVNIRDLGRFEKDSVVDEEALRDAGLLKENEIASSSWAKGPLTIPWL